MNRRQFLFSGAGLPLFAAGYSFYWEPRWVELTQRLVLLPACDASVRLLHISDLHASCFVSLKMIQHALNLGLSAKPDLICITGDFVTNTRGYDRDRYISVLRRASRAAPTFAVLGNHDGGRWAAIRGGNSDTAAIRSLLDRAGIQVLHNRSVAFRSLALVGVGDIWSGEMNPARAFARVPPIGARILLSHNPDTKDLLGAYPWDLMLCGHTHGGQVIFPFAGPRYAPVRDKRYVAGLRPWHGRQIHVNRGIGNIGGVRFRCRPEVSLLILAAAPTVSEPSRKSVLT